MVLDITLFRSPTTLEIIRKSHEKRGGVAEDIDDVVEHDEGLRKCIQQKNGYSRLENVVKKVIGLKNKAKKKDNKNNNQLMDHVHDDRANEPLVQESENQLLVPVNILESIPDIEQTVLETLTLEQLIQISQICRKNRNEIDEKENEHQNMRTMLLKKIGNILHESVPNGPNDDFNVTIKIQEHESSSELRELKPHYELIKMIDGVDTKAGSKISGNRGYFLKGPCVYLSQALQQYALSKLDRNGFVAVQTPFFMNESVMSDVAQLSQFDEELYKVISTGSDEDNSDTTKYLIATSEQPLTALHMGEKISEKKLPIKYAGISTCFRKEAGRNGKDASGIFRVHQFDKVEQFVICSSENENSWKCLEEMLENATGMLDDLKISYRVVNIASGELNLAASKKYDIEGFFPGSKTYRELVSCSNCTDYHSRNLAIKHTIKTDPSGRYVHMLNATMCAVTRMICIILETYQSEKGIIVPDALKPYMPDRFKELIQFV